MDDELLKEADLEAVDGEFYIQLFQENDHEFWDLIARMVPTDVIPGCYTIWARSVGVRAPELQKLLCEYHELGLMDLAEKKVPSNEDERSGLTEDEWSGLAEEALQWVRGERVVD